MWWRKIACFMILALCVSGIAGARTSTSLTYPIIFTQEPVRSEEPTSVGVFSRTHAEGSRIVRLDPEGGLTVLTAEFASASDPSVSFDGKRILFAAKRTPEDSWNIYEMNADGSDKTQITRDLGDCTEPIYLPRASVTPPSFEERVPWITFVSTAAQVVDETGKEPAPSLYVMNLKPVKDRGTVLWRTTYNLGGSISPTVMHDGRVLFSSRRAGIFSLLTITWAGDNLNPFYGAHEEPLVKAMAVEMPDRTVVFVESEGDTPDLGGRLARVSLRRPLHSHEVLSRGGGRYRTPQVFPNGMLGVAYAPEGQSYGIYFFDFETGKPGKLIYDDPEWNEVDAMPLLPHPEPLARIPMLEFASVLDIQGFKQAGQLHCMSVYDSDRPEVKQLQPGQVKWARFVEGLPYPVGTPVDSQDWTRGAYWPPPTIQTRILGEAPVEPDGSFFVNIVGNTPFFIQLLDENKMALYSMQSWIWVRSGSQRGCIGCHEDKELAPENRATQALLKKQPAFLIDPPQKRRTVDFQHDVAPIIERRCVRCHSGPKPKGGLDLSLTPTARFNQAYERLLDPGAKRRYVIPGHARESFLIWQIFGKPMGERREDRDAVRQMPPKSRKPLSDAEKQIFVEWIDLGAAWNNRPPTDQPPQSR